MSANEACLILVLARAGGAIALSPLLMGVPVMARILAAAAFGFALFPMVEQPVLPEQMEFLAIIPLAAIEGAVGAFMGWSASLLMAAMRSAGSIADIEFQGIGAETAAGPFAEFQTILGAVVFFLTNGHHWFLSGLLRSFSAMPAGSGSFAPESAVGLLAMGLEIAIKLAAPVMVASLLVTLGLLFAARLWPGAASLNSIRPVAVTGALLASVGATLALLSWKIPEFGIVWSSSFGL